MILFFDSTNDTPEKARQRLFRIAAALGIDPEEASKVIEEAQAKDQDKAE